MGNEFITAKIQKIIKENYRINTLVLDTKIKAEPGQFLMVWIPGMDEKPFGIADNNPLTLTICNVGPFSSKICSLKKGDLLSFKGPFGKSFNSNKEKEVILIGGGYGVIPLLFLAKELSKKGTRCTLIIGAKTKKDLIYEEKFKKLKCKVLLCTDDGSCGEKGFATNVLENLLKKNKFKKLYACGPNPMLKAIAEVCNKNNLDYEFSLEAYMKCGLGLCGSCAIGDKLVCKDGPVFTKKELQELKF